MYKPVLDVVQPDVLFAVDEWEEANLEVLLSGRLPWQVVDGILQFGLDGLLPLGFLLQADVEWQAKVDLLLGYPDGDP